MQNTQKLQQIPPKGLKYAVLRVQFGKIYTGQNFFTRAPPVVPVTNMRYVHDVAGCLSSEACAIGDVDGTQLSEIHRIQKSQENKPSSLDYDAIEILSREESADQSCDLAQDEKKIITREGIFNYLKKI